MQGRRGRSGRAPCRKAVRDSSRRARWARRALISPMAVWSGVSHGHHRESAQTRMLVPKRRASSRFSGRIAMHFRIGPAVARIAFEGIVHDKAAIMKEAIAARRLVVVCVRLRWSCREGERRVIQSEGERQFGQFLVREDLFHLPAECTVHAVVVIGVEEPAVLQIGAQIPDVPVRQHDVAVSGKEDHRDTRRAVRCRLRRRCTTGSTSSPAAVRAKRSRLTSADGSLYQSPPPAYFTRPIRRALDGVSGCASIRAERTALRPIMRIVRIPSK